MPTTIHTRPPMVPKQLAAMIGREVKWVRARCRKGEIPTLPPHRAPYLIPPNVLFTFGMEEGPK